MSPDDASLIGTSSGGKLGPGGGRAPMEQPTGHARIVRFGVFEVDLRSGELHKQGLKIRLQEQPFEILAMLLEHPGDVVTREELQKKLWHGETFVDFEHGLNKAINKIREALGDSADTPRFVETLPRRGYRFVYPVQGPPVAAVYDRRPQGAATGRWPWPALGSSPQRFSLTGSRPPSHRHGLPASCN